MPPTATAEKSYLQELAIIITSLSKTLGSNCISNARSPNLLLSRFWLIRNRICTVSLLNMAATQAIPTDDNGERDPSDGLSTILTGQKSKATDPSPKTGEPLLTQRHEATRDLQDQCQVDTQNQTPKAQSRDLIDVTEGRATIRVPTQKPDSSKEKSDPLRKDEGQTPTVFYNPIQQFNRDLSVLAIKVFVDNLNLERKLALYRRSLRQDGVVKKGKKRKRDDKDGENVGDAKAPPPELPEKTILDRFLEEPVPDNWEFGRLVSQKEIAYPPPEPGIRRTKGHCLKSYLRKIFPDGEDIRLQLGDQPAILKGENIEADNAGEQAKAGRLPLALGSKPLFPIRILDALSATGLRAIRYAKEVQPATQIIANDLSGLAVNAIQRNIISNNVAPLVSTSKASAQSFMYEAAATAGTPQNSQFHVIDLDPYGSAASFLDSAVQALADGGLLCVTCTDAGVFASTAYLEKCFSQYGGLPAKGAWSHEAGLRIILHTTATSAARYGLTIEPLLSLSVDFYVRLFVRVRKSPADVKFLAGKTMVVYNCDHGCGAWRTQYLARHRPFDNARGETLHKYSLGIVNAHGSSCEHCGFKTHLAGPMWGGPIHNPQYVQRILDVLPTLDPKVYGTIPRIEGMLTVARDESMTSEATPLEPSELSSPSPYIDQQTPDRKPFPPLPPENISPYPFFVIPSHLARTLHSQAPSDAQFRGALRHLGYRCTSSHCKPGSIVTDAPWDVIWEVMRHWARKSRAKVEKLKPGTAGYEIWRRGNHEAGESSGEGHPRDAGRSDPMFVQKQVELRDITSKASDTQELRTQLEAFLYRLDPNQRVQPPNGVSPGPDIPSESSPAAAAEKPQANTQPTPSITETDVRQRKGESQTGENESPLAAARRKGIIFDEKLGADPMKKGKVRYQMNPRPEWGPMSKAKM